MLKYKIIKKETLLALEGRVKEAERLLSLTEGKFVGLENEKTRLTKELNASQEKVEVLEEELDREKMRHKGYVAREKDKTLAAKKKWLNGYPNETYGGDKK